MDSEKGIMADGVQIITFQESNLDVIKMNNCTFIKIPYVKL